MSGLWFAHELRGNPVNSEEQRILQDSPKDAHESVRSYTLTVGDLCFVAIGQIVGRKYRAMRYQPSGNTVLNSPTHDAKLCEQVRALWSGDNPRKKLFDSLVLDYSTQGIFNGRSLDGWDVASDLQINAALRLLYYFPKESAVVIAQRLKSFNGVNSKIGIDTTMKREVTNGVRADKFIGAVRWSKEPAIQEALAELKKHSDDPNILKAIEGETQ